MKKLILTLLLFVFSLVGYSQKDTLYKSLFVTYYSNLFDVSTKTEKIVDFSVYFRKDSVVFLNNEKKEKSFFLIENHVSTTQMHYGLVYMYKGSSPFYREVLITVVKKEGNLLCIGISDGEFLLVFDILKILDI